MAHIDICEIWKNKLKRTLNIESDAIVYFINGEIYINSASKTYYFIYKNNSSNQDWNLIIYSNLTGKYITPDLSNMVYQFISNIKTKARDLSLVVGYTTGKNCHDGDYPNHVILRHVKFLLRDNLYKHTDRFGNIKSFLDSINFKDMSEHFQLQIERLKMEHAMANLNELLQEGKEIEIQKKKEIEILEKHKKRQLEIEYAEKERKRAKSSMRLPY